MAKSFDTRNGLGEERVVTGILGGRPKASSLRRVYPAATFACSFVALVLE
jgi:hypothetical protein